MTPTNFVICNFMPKWMHSPVRVVDKRRRCCVLRNEVRRSHDGAGCSLMTISRRGGWLYKEDGKQQGVVTQLKQAGTEEAGVMVYEASYLVTVTERSHHGSFQQHSVFNRHRHQLLQAFLASPSLMAQLHKLSSLPIPAHWLSSVFVHLSVQ